MNCEQFRLQIDATPDEPFDGRDAHLAECPACADYARRADEFERLLVAAMQIPVPDMPMPDTRADASTADASNVVELARRRRAKLPVWFAIAASVVLAVVVGFRLGVAPAPDAEALANEVLAHMVHEPDSRVVTSRAVATAELQSVIRPANASISDELGLVSYAHSCVVAGKAVPHLVVQGRNGPVTILIMPHRSVDAAVPLEDEYFHGVILPVSKGSVAIIGRKGESIDDVRDRVGKTIQLSI